MKKYKTILIDPPWEMEFIKREVRPNQVAMPYPMMTLDEIKALPVYDLADEECNLFLWTTQTYLPDAFDVLKAWRFNYHVAITWDKENGLTQFGFHRRTEFLLYAYKGKLTFEKNGRAMPTLIQDLPELFEGSSPVHSRKPISTYRILEAKTASPRLEMFARARRSGWDSWGNEIVSDVNIETVASISKEKQMSN